MDDLTGLLDGPRARGAFLLRSLMEPPWSIDVRDLAPLSVMAMVRGHAWLVTEHGGPTRLVAGDVALMRGPETYRVVDDPATAPQIVIHPGQQCRSIDGEELAESMHLGVRTWGNDPEGSTVMLTGTYETDTAIGQRLLSALPPVVVLPAADGDQSLIDLLGHEIVRDDPGQEVVLDRLLDLLVIAAMRDWFGRPDASTPSWYRAHADPTVGAALRLLQNNPAHPWTIATLAAEVGVSRAALARRFNDLVGEPPMTFLTGWRLTLAADLLLEPDTTIASVATRVGYGSPFALSTAFKRVHGISPHQHRQLAASA